MPTRLEKERNTNDDPNRVAVSVDSTTAQLLFIANPRRIEVIVSNSSNQACWVRLQTAATDNVGRDIFIIPGISKVITGNDNVYTGEISVIMNVGGTKTIHGVEI